MPTINGKHWYRFNFLKSEAWENIRLETLVKFDAICQICRKRDLSNDVHHIWYDDPLRVEENQLTVLCRDCHDKIHLLIEPTGARTKEEKADLLKQFKEAAHSILLTLGPCKSEKQCIGCGSWDAYKIDPVVRGPVLGKGGMSLCVACQTRIYSEIPSESPHTSALWSQIKAVIGSIQCETKIEMQNRSSAIVCHIEKIRACHGITIESFLLTTYQNSLKLRPLVETISHRHSPGSVLSEIV